MSTKLPLLYSMFGLAGTGGEGDPAWLTLPLKTMWGLTRPVGASEVAVWMNCQVPAVDLCDNSKSHPCTK